jgi:hypothetical protein
VSSFEKRRYKNIINALKYSFAGDECVKNDFVEDVRIPTTYGLALLTNVRQRMEKSKCSSSSMTTKTEESVGEPPI